MTKNQKKLLIVLICLILIFTGIYTLTILGFRHSTLKAGNTSDLVDAVKGIADPPLPRKSLSFDPQAKAIYFTIDDKNQYEHLTIDVVLDPKTFGYKATTSSNGGFSYTQAGGVVCFTKQKFQYTYCFREKFTPAAATRQLLNDNMHVRELTDDEQEVNNLLMSNDWAPDNLLAALMSHVETAIQLLQDNHLENNAKLFWKSDDGNPISIGIIKDVRKSFEEASVKTKGVDLASIILTLMRDRDWRIPIFNFEHEENDRQFVGYMKAGNIEFSEYQLAQ